MQLIRQTPSDTIKSCDSDSWSPQHVALIMDGNRRWAKLHGLPVYCGHEKGAKVLREIVQRALSWNIKVLTAFAFSTENWNRTQREVESLMVLFEFFLYDMRDELNQNGIRLTIIGDRGKLPKNLCSAIDHVEKATENNTMFDLVIGMNYGGRDEILRAIQRAMVKNLDVHAMTQKDFYACLDTAQWPDPDLLIRTSGEKRISNFLLWQISYTEIIFSDILWPDFTPEIFDEMVLEYQKRKRRVGK